MTFRDLLMKHGIVPGGQITFTEEEQQAIDIGWAEFSEIANKGAPPGQRLYVPPEVLRTMRGVSASSALTSLAIQVLITPTDPKARQRACSAATKSLVLAGTPLYFYNVAEIFARAEEASIASCLFQEFLARHERAGGPSLTPGRAAG